MESEEIQTNTVAHQQDEKDDSGIEQDSSFIYIRIAVEDHNLQKVLKFNLDDTVWNAKQKVLQVLVRVLIDGLNFGLYLPSCNGRAGKFLDESRCLREYPLIGPVSYLEFKYKRRVYKAIHLVQKNINLKISTKKFIDCIKTNQISKVTRYLEKGFDPNFHISNDETVLSCACIDLIEPRSMILALVNGGAHLDFRTRNGGFTPLHKSAIHHRKESIVILLELGASPNVYDNKGLTPLYHTVLNNHNESINDSSYCCQLLLQDHSIVNCRDDYLSTELHQACRLGLVQHVEHLLFYRADINAINTAGNTPLHICTATNQEACARVLLFRGADVKIVNKSNQTPYELALVSQNCSIATIIQSHKPDHVVPYRETPLINPKRRSIYIEQDKHRIRSLSTTTSSLSLANRSQSMPKLNSINILHRSNSPANENLYQQHPPSRSSSPKSFSVNSDHGLGSECTSRLSSNSPNAVNGCYIYKRKRLYAAAPGRKCMCIKSYRANLSGELSLHKGDIVDILSVGEQGYLEGRCKNVEGWFPSNHVQDICVFKNGEMTNDDTIVISRDALSALMINNDTYTPRTVVLQRGKKGFGFVLQGSRVAGKLFQPTRSFPALQFLDSIEKGSNAEKAGLKKNDYILEINGINVTCMPHEECANLIKRAGNTLALKIVTTSMSTLTHNQRDSQSHYTTFQSLPYRRKAPLRPSFEKSFGEDLDRTSAEYEYGSMSEAYVSVSKQQIENIYNGSSSLRIKNKPAVPARDSSLYDYFINCQNQQIYNRFQPLIPAVSVPNLSSITNIRCNSNSSSNEADEELSLSSMNSNLMAATTNLNEENGIGIYMAPSLSLSTTNMSTFKVTSSNHLPAKPSEVKRRSNNRKQTSIAIHSNNNNALLNSIENETFESSPPPPPPPPFPANFRSINKVEPQTVSIIEQKKNKIDSALTTTKNDFQMQIEQAKGRLKKINNETSSKSILSSTKLNGLNKPIHQNNTTNSNHYHSSDMYNSPELKNIIIEDKISSNEFPSPPSPSTLRRSTATVSTNKTSVIDPRLDTHFSSVIAQRAAAATARRHENLLELDYSSNGLPPSRTFFNNCIITNGIQTTSSSCPQRFSATANQLLENLKRRGGNITSMDHLVKSYN
ncbi:unnamed protein product [Rotaria socialis]|uniref:Uncharacterized protein n=2 Tax=Rotaria socialis TaxID=392032 RepID=A0A817QS91_9BILA|nr:unnamed protein product [Rotaria socialis]CAF4109996.1 unnamed protein product [Rotaria socialis]